MHEYQIPKTAKNSQRNCNCPIRTPSNTLTYYCSPTPHRELSLRGYQHLSLDSECRQKYRQWFSYTHHIIPHAHFIRVYFKERAVIEIKLSLCTSETEYQTNQIRFVYEQTPLKQRKTSLPLAVYCFLMMS